MDYEKEYKELHTFISDLYPFMSEYCKEKVEGFLPELKESEDERIRKSLLEYLHTLPNHYAHSGVCAPEWITWLEKQENHANFCNKIQIGDKVTRNRDGVLVNLSQLNRVAKKDENQSEQKPIDKIEPKFKVKYAGNEYNVFETKNIAGVTFYGIEDEPNHIDYVKADNCEIIGVYAIKENGSPYPTKPAVFTEQKTAEWSEEDKEHVESILEMLEGMCKKGATFTSTRFAVSQDIDWLKTLKDRVQPKQEWSEEDEKILNDAIGAVGTTDYYTYDDKQVIENWLKNLKERCAWKPSDEQMKFLQKCIEAYNEVTFPTEVRVLSSLYNDLKKLREE